MYVQNYIPDAIEVPGNVAESTWPAKLAFVRKVAFLHLVSLVVLFLGITVARTYWPTIHLAIAVSLYLGISIAESTVRILWRGRKREVFWSLVLAPALVISLATLIVASARFHLPLWAALVPPLFGAAYISLCGRDFSFIGLFCSGAFGSITLVPYIATRIHGTGINFAWPILVSSAYWLYYCWDLASLMSRRRTGEEITAVIDLYRDILNIFGYSVRCIRHWQQHRIWTLPWSS